MTSDCVGVQLGELVEIKHGFAFKGEYFVDGLTPYQLVTPGNFAIGGGFQVGKPKHYAGPVPPEYILRPGDLVVTMTDLSRGADTLGYAALVPSNSNTVWLHNQRVGLVQIKAPERVLPSYLHFVMRTAEYRHWVVASATGSTVKHTSPSRICAYRFRLPPLEAQQAVGELLEQLENRIAILRETNTTLEAIAQALFKSWFVDFDPVRAKQRGFAPPGLDEATAALFPGQFQEAVPLGWKAMVLSDAFDLNPPRSLIKGAVASYLDMASLAASGHCVEAPLQRAFSSGSKFRNGDSLLARITPCLENGKSAFVDFLPDGEVGWGSTEFIVLRPKPPLPAYFGYLLCRHQSFREHAIHSMAGTSGRQRVQNDVLGRYMLAMPDSAVASAFGALVEPLQSKIAANHVVAQTLTTLRDALLPRLISGQLRIPDAEAQVAEAIA